MFNAWIIKTLFQQVCYHISRYPLKQKKTKKDSTAHAVTDNRGHFKFKL